VLGKLKRRVTLQATTTQTGDIDTLAGSWQRSLRARKLSPATLRIYGYGVAQLAAHLAEKGMPTAVANITREHVEDFISDVLSRSAPATGASYYCAADRFFKWLVADGEITASPMVNMKKPKVPEQLPPVLEDAQLRALLKTCERADTPENRRDMAILRVFMDTGARLAEVAGLDIADVDLNTGTIRLLGKGGSEREVAIGVKTTAAIDRYLRKRAMHPAARLTALWLGHRGRYTFQGIAAMVANRGKAAGLDRIHPHMLRHSFAHGWLAGGGSERGLMQLAGWRSTKMLGRYGASLAAERARAEHRQRSPGDRL
jgi:site-specific recombinase XerD